MLAPSRPAPTMRTGPVRRDSVTSRLRSVSAPSSRRGVRGAGDREQLAELHLSQLAHLRPIGGCRGSAGRTAAHELDDRMSDGVEHAAHDAVAARVQGELDHRVPVVAPAAAGCAPCRPRSGRPRARCRSSAAAMTCGVTRPAHLGDVGLRDAERRVREHMRELAVVREQQQAARLGVEAADVEDALLEVVGELA